jgi:hypothetical protein
LERSKLASWGTDWSREREEFGLFHESEYEGHHFMRPPKQDYADTGKLRLTGLRVAGNLVWLDARKEISHPRDRFKPKYQRSVTLHDIMKAPTRRTLSGLASEIYNPPYSIIFTHVEETESTFELTHIAVKSHEFASDFASFLAGSNYVFAYVEDLAGDASLELGDLHLLVPRTAALDDIVVSLYGSRCLHLLRPMPSISSEFKYLGPVAGIACGQEYTLKYTSKNKFGLRVISKGELTPGSHTRETFVLA